MAMWLFILPKRQKKVGESQDLISGFHPPHPLASQLHKTIEDARIYRNGKV